MAHLDTAYQQGMKQAEEDFAAELQKHAQGAPPPAPITPQPAQPPIAGRGLPQPPAPISGRENTQPAPAVPAAPSLLGR